MYKLLTNCAGVWIFVTVLANGLALGDLHSDPDTGKWVEDGFDVRVYAQLPDHVGRFAFARGGSFGTDLYVTSRYGKIYKVTSDGGVTLFGTAPDDLFGITFSDPASDFGDYMYLGSGDGYWGGNRTIYRMDSSGSAEVFFDGSNFLGGTANAINFAPEGGPFASYLYTQDDNPNRVYRIDSSGIATQFGGDIPLAFDFIFDQWGRFEGNLFVIQSEKSEHGSGSDNIWRVEPDGTTTMFLPDASQVHNGGGDITPPGSAFGGDIYYIDNHWYHSGDVYRVTPDGTRVTFARGFSVGDGSDVVYGPDGTLYVADAGNSRTIYQIAPLADVVALEIQGPNEVADNSQAQFKAIATYDDGYQNDVTDRIAWSVEPTTYASINYSGLLSTQQIHDVEESVTITAQYTSGDVTVSAEKDVTIFSVCPSGYALQFDGENDQVNCGNLGITEPVSILMWLKPDDTSSDRRILGQLPETGDAVAGLIAIKANGDAHDIYVWNRYSWEKIIDLPSFWGDRWHHLAVVFRDDGSVAGFFDGIEQLNAISSFDFDSLSIGLGVKYKQYGKTYDGLMDEVAIYDRALSVEEIRANMHQHLVGSEPNLIAYWNFDQGQGQDANDISGHGNDAQLGNSPDIDDSDPCWVDSDAPVGICTLEGLVKRDLSGVFDAKLNILEQLDEAMAQEQIVLDMLNTHFKNRDFGTAEKKDVVKAKQEIHTAIQHEVQAETDVYKSINSLTEALLALDCEVDPHNHPELLQSNPTITADINGDRVIDYRDFAVLASYWLESYQLQ